MKKKVLSWDEIYHKLTQLESSNYGKKLYGVPRGGSIVAGLTGRAVDTIEEADVIVDDIIDSGMTYKKYQLRYPKIPFVVLFNKNEFPGYDWVEFPWEKQETATEVYEQVNRLAILFGERKEDAIKQITKAIKPFK